MIPGCPLTIINRLQIYCLHKWHGYPNDNNPTEITRNSSRQKSEEQVFSIENAIEFQLKMQALCIGSEYLWLGTWMRRK